MLGVPAHGAVQNGALDVLPEALDKEVARLKLMAMGGGLEQLTDEQVKYLESWQEGT